VRASSINVGYGATLHEIPTANGTLRYQEAGEGPVLLFLHGSGPGVTGWRNFRGVVPFFAERFRCLVLEFPGFGVSDDFGGHPMVTAFDAMVSFVEGLGLDRIDVVGNSMVYNPALVTDELIEERWHLATDREALAAARRMYSKAAFTRMMAAMAASDAAMPWTMLHKLTCPTLLTWGRDDRVSPLDMALIPMRTNSQCRTACVSQLRALGDDRGQRGVPKHRAGIPDVSGNAVEISFPIIGNHDTTHRTCGRSTCQISQLNRRNPHLSARHLQPDSPASAAWNPTTDRFAADE
jgi:hypothetical protein